MIFYDKFLWAVLGIACLGIDVTIFFVCVRILLTWKSIPWLKAFDDAGRRLVDSVTGRIGSFWNEIMKKQLTEKGQLLVSLIALELARLIICQIARLV